jgi:DNA-binding NtrC family response regulator
MPLEQRVGGPAQGPVVRLRVEDAVAEPDVLIVHDGRQIRDFFRDVLQEARLRLHAGARRGRGGREFRPSRPPLVITQLRLLPDWGDEALGIALLKWFRRGNPDVAVIVASGAVVNESEVLRTLAQRRT